MRHRISFETLFHHKNAVKDEADLPSLLFIKINGVSYLLTIITLLIVTTLSIFFNFFFNFEKRNFVGKIQNIALVWLDFEPAADFITKTPLENQSTLTSLPPR